MKSKNPDKYTKEELKKIIDEIFEYYKKLQITENEYLQYLATRKKMNREQAEALIYDAWRHDLIYIGATIVKGKGKKVIWRPEDYEMPPPSELNDSLKEK